MVIIMKDMSYQTDIIELRGHHLDMLLNYLFNRPTQKEFLEDIQQYGHGRKHNLRMYKILRRVVEGDGIKVRVVDYLDEICKGCDKYTDRCKTFKDSKEEVNVYGLNMGKVYNSDEIVEAIFKNAEKVIESLTVDESSE
ncbi:MAG: DUF1284 domain-containing protein [Candidatus Aenigmarchaeota archaeon]|nr:DUF1284 domain-containing protein [Candidatus Aenigmarchaeota archaeon]